jgi:HPt (histidine-containing phosphotransfer) domain-containing protein
MTRDDETLPLLDPTTLAELGALGRDLGRDVRQEIFDLFTSTTPARVVELRARWDDDDLAAFARIAHALRSSAAAVGALQLARALEQAERTARAGQRTAAAEALGDVERTLPSTLAALSGLPSSTS